jgi:hypothetical protein
MAKESKQNQIQKSLNAAARLLNRATHMSESKGKDNKNLTALKAMKSNLFHVALHQAFCKDEEIPLGAPTTDKNLARNTAILHHTQFGHITDVIESH